MLPQRTKLARGGCLLSLVVLLAVGIVLTNRYQAMTSCHGNQPVLTSFEVTIDPGQYPQLVEQSRQFAYKHSFRFDVADLDQPASDLRIHMTRRDVEIATRISSSPGNYEIGFYNHDCIHPTTVFEIDDLVADLKSLIGQVPGATLVEEQ
jgi:hypothetical protein